MIVQIYGTKTLKDAEALAHLGVDFIGLEVEADLSDQKLVKQIVERMRDRVTTVLLPLFTDLDEILRVVNEIQPHVLHLCSADMLPLDEASAFRKALGRRHPEFSKGVKLLQAVPVGLPGRSHEIDSLGLALAYQKVADIILLDTHAGDYSAGSTEMAGWIGITGKTHDWGLSREIVTRCRKPAILAGGLNPENVTAAMEAVRPWGVDSHTGTNLHKGRKDLKKVDAFVKAARNWEAKRAAERMDDDGHTES
jgi:phosphoribosylanthranilate isomerase